MKPTTLKRAIQIGNKLELFLYQPEDLDRIESEIAKKVERGLNAGKTVVENGHKSFVTVDALFDSSKIKNHEGQGYTWSKCGEKVKCEKTLIEVSPNGHRTETSQGFVWKLYAVSG